MANADVTSILIVVIISSSNCIIAIVKIVVTVVVMMVMIFINFYTAVVNVCMYSTSRCTCTDDMTMLNKVPFDARAYRVL